MFFIKGEITLILRSLTEMFGFKKKVCFIAWALLFMTVLGGLLFIPVTSYAEEINATTTYDSVENHLGESLGEFKLTGYYPGTECNGKWGNITAMGTEITPGRTIAVDKKVIPLGTWVYINLPEDGWTLFLAEDTGGAIKKNRIDVACANRKTCYLDKYNSTCEVRFYK